MARPSRLAWGLLLVAAAGCASPAPLRAGGPPATLELTPCPVAGSETPALCGRYPVFEDRAARSGRMIGLKVLVLLALTDPAAPDPVVVLAGGPGVAAASGVTGAVARFFAPIRRQRAVVFVDQRGTGASGPLQCRLVAGGNPFGDLLPADRIRACRETLEARANLRLYTTPIAMDDLDDVRAALGHATVNLYGVSYGSLAALQYLRQHPARVRSLTLVGVATPAQKLPLHFAGGAQAAMDRLIADCTADPACRRAFPDVRADLDATLARFAAGPVSVDLPAAGGRAAERVSLSRAVFVERLRLMLYDLWSARRVPLVLNHAARGDWAPFVQATRPTLTGTTTGFAMGMYPTVTCAESVPFITEDEIGRESRGSFVGEDRTRVHVRACREWPRADRPPDFAAPVVSPAPVLMLSGELDPATPAHYARIAARHLPNSRQVPIRNAAHVYFDECLRDVVADFMSRGSAREVDASCVEALRRPPFVTS
jgi:pimeloyl-ACP methyl ester carboxylesterase